MVKPRVKNETVEGRFKRLATTRTKRVLRDLKILGNCANKTNYYYTKKDVDKIFMEIGKELKRVKSLFDKPNKEEFSL